jgi:phosphoglycerate dehydrogenase-like enzyme
VNDISALEHSREGEIVFCLGTAPHLKYLQLKYLTDKLTIGCNQLLLDANNYDYDFICFVDYNRFKPLLPRIKNLNKHTSFVLPKSFKEKVGSEQLSAISHQTFFVNPIRTFPGNTDFFSHNLAEQVYYPGTVFAIQIQLAVYLGCKRIYLLGLDAQYDEQEAIYNDVYDQTDIDKGNKLIFSHLRDWLKRTFEYLQDRGIEMYNAAGEHSRFEDIPKIRFEAAVGKPKVAVTSKTFSRNDLLVSELKKYIPNVKLNTLSHKLNGDELADFLGDADGIILGTEKFGRDVIQKLPLLKFIAKYGVGIDNIDFEAVEENHIKLKYRKGTNSDSVAELTICHILTLLRNLHLSGPAVRSGRWKKLPGRELSEVTVGIIGYGHIGSVVCDKLARLHTGKILVCDIKERIVPPPMRLTHLDYLLKNSDVVTVHISMEPTNYHIINDEFLSKMKDGAILINTARGDLVDEAALLKAIESEKLSGCALDVLEDEPNINPDFAKNNNIIISCHQGGSSNRAIENMGWAAIEDLLNLLGLSTE